MTLTTRPTLDPNPRKPVPVIAGTGTGKPGSTPGLPVSFPNRDGWLSAMNEAWMEIDPDFEF